MDRRSPAIRLLLTCEHGGNQIPPEHRPLFDGADDVLASHRGWDPGALVLARALGRRLGLEVHATTVCRLLVEANRAPTNPRIWSAFTAGLPRREKEDILERWYWPHRRRVEQAVREAAREGGCVFHVAVHSFTPVLDGEERNADVGLLYDPSRPTERRLCAAWAERLRDRVPGLRVRMNYPYRGTADGLPTWLRHRFPPGRYAGMELEVNQALLGGRRRAEVTRALGRTLADLVGSVATT